MAALTGAIDTQAIRPHSEILDFKIANGEVVYIGGYYALNTGGYLTQLADTAGFVPLGPIVAGGSGNADAAGAIGLSLTGNTSGSPVPEAQVVVSGFTGNDLAVSGASTIAHVGELVYLGTDNWTADLTLTETVNIPAVGRIVGFNSSTSFKVRFFSMDEMLRKQGVLRHMNLGSIHTTALEAQGTSANLLNVTMTQAGIVRGMFWRPTGFDASYTSGSTTLHTNVAGLDISGGVFTVAFGSINGAADMALYNTTTTITNTGGGAEFADGEAVRVATKSGTGLTPAIDTVSIEIHMEWLELPAL